MARSVARLAVIGLMVAAAAAVAQAGDNQEWGGTWQNGPPTTFPQAFSRFDGGYYPATGLVYFLGGRLADNNTDGSIWTFNPATGIYADTGFDMPIPISNYTANLLNTPIGFGFHVFCGRDSAGTQTFAVQAYFPDTNVTLQLGPEDNFPGPVACGAGLNAVVNNKAYIAGGFDGTNMGVQTWVFDPAASPGSRWTRLTNADLPQGLAYITTAVVDGKIYAIGGAYWDGVSALINVDTAMVLDPAAPNPTWTPIASLPEVCSSSRAWGFDTGSLYVDPTDMTPLAGKIIAGCGVWSTAIQAVYAYTVATNTWEPFPPFLTARRDMAGELLPIPGEEALWVWGGYDGTSVNTTTVEYYSLALIPVELQSFTIE
jgi:N-acetylneuraminic acid mutarotase